MASKLHPLTVPVRGASRALGLAIAGSVLGSMVQEPLRAAGLLPFWMPSLGMVLAVLFVIGALAYEILRYRFFAYELTDDSLYIHSGVLFRRERDIPLGRIQNVDITRSIFQRALGIGAVGIETAGGSSTEAALNFVSRAEATRLQEGIRTRKRSLDESDSIHTDTEDTSGESHERLFELSDEDLVLYSLLSLDPRLFSIVFVLVPTVAPFATEYLAGRAAAVVFVLGLFGLVLAGLAVWILGGFSRFVGYYGFTLTRVGDELRYERGLLQRYDGSIPAGKIQTIVIEENVLMRHFGYASLTIETAGYGPGSESGAESAVPLAKRDRLLELARDVEDFGEVEFARPAPEARRRYTVRYAIVVTALLGAGFLGSWLVGPVPWYGLVALYAAVPIAARKKWAHRGWDIVDGYVITRTGFWRRRTHVVPDDRVQTVIDRRTLFQRRWGLGTVVIDTASSGGFASQEASVIDVRTATADAVRSAVTEKLLTAVGVLKEPPEPRD
ncbi:PH domain-containing protein [Halodesulfurarchaeum formicicum]|nr:PH domain-containing protein [Halodesulfurarchaeum formicicum]